MPSLRAPATLLRQSLRPQRAHRRSLPTAAAATHPLVFLGTPDCATRVLAALLDAAAAPDALFHVAAVVSQPGKPRGRGRGDGPPPPSPVAALAAARGVPERDIWTPASARDPAFLAQLAALQPALCVTAAYGNYLPAAFLATPSRGTLNIHPSLLPLYRGAAPVQRALAAGDAETGVTLAYTVQSMDSGPVLAQTRVSVGPEETHTQLLDRLFALGTQLLLHHLPAALDGSAAAAAVPQDGSAACDAPKVCSEEGLLDFQLPARVLHCRVRAFEGWPGTRAVFRVGGTDAEPLTLKVLAATLGPPGDGTEDRRVVTLVGGALRCLCADGSALHVTQVQAPGGRSMGARDYAAGLRGKPLFRD